MAADFDINAWASGVIAAIISSAALFVSLYTWKKSTQRQDYSDLDTMYQNFLDVAVQDPTLRNKNEIEKYMQMTQNEKGRVKYDAYAYMAFNFCESVFDYTRGENNSQNKEAWLPAVVTETSLHWKWFFNPDNFDKFDNQTRNDILGTIKDDPQKFDSNFQKEFHDYITNKIFRNRELMKRNDLEEFIAELSEYIQVRRADGHRFVDEKGTYID